MDIIYKLIATARRNVNYIMTPSPPKSSDTTSDPYLEDCPFCNIANAYQASHPSSSSTSSTLEELLSYVPESPDPNALETPCHLILAAPDALAFLDIMPLTPGHVLVTTRAHRVKLGDVPATEGKEMGFWLPLVSAATARAVGVTDWNVVQNNGPRAAQVVPHVHFHIVPRPGSSLPSVTSKSWTMFGRGLRGDLDDDEAVKIAANIRAELRKEIEKTMKPKSTI